MCLALGSGVCDCRGQDKRKQQGTELMVITDRFCFRFAVCPTLTLRLLAI
jgi:hypothetical protein